MDEKDAPQERATAQKPEPKLPPQTTPFIGRDAELSDIAHLLAKPACRLLTLVGPGGIGKTRLAVQAARQMQATFTDGICFVDLQALDSADLLASAVADALAVPLSGQETPSVQVCNYLRERKLLLLLDSFEHLLALSSAAEAREEDAPALLTTLLHTAPQVKLLVTSREALNLQEEWLYSVRGLPVPPNTDASDLPTYGAVQLFVERARQVRPDFSPDEDPAGIARICQLVEGLPLALEMAAAWTKTMRCTDIADEIQRNLDFLTTSLRNVPDRHRSIQAVFEQSWKLLGREARDVFKRLAVFRGGFTRRAAEEVAGASLAILSALVDKSLLRWEPEGRYQMHELLRQYAAERLHQSPAEMTRVRALHGTYYTNFLARRREAIMGGQQQQATAAVAPEVDNVRAAWQWAVETEKPAALQRAAYTLAYFFDFRNRYQEGIDAFESAVESLDSSAPDEERRRALAELLLQLGWVYIRVGRHAEAQRTIERSQTLYAELDAAPPPGLGTDPLTALGILAAVSGDYDKALALGREARRRGEARADKHNLQLALYILADAALAQGQPEAAGQYAQEAHALTQANEDRWFRAYVLNILGDVARAQGDVKAAAQHYQISYTLREEFDDPEGMAVALNHLGQTAVQQENYAEARRLYEQSLSIYQEINNWGGLATALNGLGTVACAQKEYATAHQHFQKALHMAADIHFVPLVLSTLIGIGELLLATGRVERGLKLLALVRDHPAGDQKAKERAQQRLHHYEAVLDAERFTAAVAQARTADLETITAALQTELTVPAQPAAEEAPPAPDQPLVEPLTPRELEVLELIAAGYANKDIAEELVLALGTVKWYTGQIYGKLGVSSRTQAVARARELHLLT